MVRQKTMGIIFANMHDAAVSSMTVDRALGALPFGGRFRMIDFCLSSLVSGGVTDVGIIMKENYHSLMAHVGAGKEWDLARKLEGLSIYPPFAGTSFGTAYHGRVDALYNVIPYLQNASAKYAILMDCDHVCNLDIGSFVNNHIESDADVSILCYKQPGADGKDNVQLTLDNDNRVNQLFYNVEMRENSYTSMNVMVMERLMLLRYIEEAHSHHLGTFERDVLQPMLNDIHVRGEVFEDFVMKICSMKSYFHANMSLLDSDNRARLFLSDRPVFTKVNDDAPVRYGIDSKVTNSLIADGCVVEGEVENSVLFRGVKVGPDAIVKNSIVMQDTLIMGSAFLDYVIADKRVEISSGRSLKGDYNYPLYIQKNSRF